MTAIVEALSATASRVLPVRSPGQPATARTILVADDDDDLRDLVAFKLGLAGYRVITAANGTDALAVAQRQHPDLVVLDVAMPGMNGIDVCHQMHAGSGTADIPVLILSARTQPAEVHLAYTAGADDYLTKPFHGQTLIQRIGWLLLAAG